MKETLCNILFLSVIILMASSLVLAEEFRVQEIELPALEEYSGEQDPMAELPSFDQAVGMSNPAAVYCQELGYEYKIIEGPDGQEGVCQFSASESCDEWEFLQGKCGQQYSYCAKQGYDVIIKDDGKNSLTKEYAVCADKDAEIGSVTELTSLGQKSTKATSVVEQPKISAEQITSDTPNSFDWRNYNGSNWLTPVKNQGGCGSCWAFAATGAVEAKYNIAKADPRYDIDLSEQDVLSCSNAGTCGGGVSSYALDYIWGSGATDALCFPYSASDESCSHKCTSYNNRLWKIRHYHYLDIETLKQTIVQDGPSVVVLGVGSGPGGYWDGDIYRCTNDYQINHAVVIVGYNDAHKYWILKNSWGSYWNGDGYFKLGYGECAMTPIASVDIDPEPGRINASSYYVQDGNLVSGAISDTYSNNNQYLVFGENACPSGVCGYFNTYLYFNFSKYPDVGRFTLFFNQAANDDPDFGLYFDDKLNGQYSLIDEIPNNSFRTYKYDVCKTHDDCLHYFTSRMGVKYYHNAGPGTPSQAAIDSIYFEYVELDSDGDGFVGSLDNCPFIYNPGQQDQDHDGYGSVCDCNDANPNVNPGAAEKCDGIDNNCDGTVDSFSQYCGVSRVGVCQFGTQTCSSGVWGACKGAVYPVAELCDGKDNDCDGKVDESCSSGSPVMRKYAPVVQP